MSARERYKSLPGGKSGWLRVASLWLGEDHILAVTSVRIREEYKRYHFRDIQGIAVARAPRFHVSRVNALLVLLWAIAYFVIRMNAANLEWMVWTVGLALVAMWITIALRYSCRCRIYTAVSRDELPSVYRTWTARKFLNRIEPRIAAVQGAIDPNWAQLVEERRAAGPAPIPAMRAAEPASAVSHTLAADLFVATIWLDALANLAMLRWTAPAAQWVHLGLSLILMAEAVVLFVEYHRGRLRSAMQKLAIATLVAMGAMYYVRQIFFAFRSAVEHPSELHIQTYFDGNVWTRGIEAGVCGILGLVGLAIVFRGREDAPPGMNS